jgi:hypothetical protein
MTTRIHLIGYDVAGVAWNKGRGRNDKPACYERNPVFVLTGLYQKNQKQLLRAGAASYLEK